MRDDVTPRAASPMVLDTRALAPRDRFDAWEEAVNRSFVPLRATPAGETRGDFAGSLRAQAVGRASASTVAGPGVRVERSRSEIAAADPGFVKLGLQLRGYSVISQDGRDAALAPGDFALYDTTRPYALDFDDAFRMFVVMFPIEALHVDRDRLRLVTASRFSGRQGAGAIASTLLRSMSVALERDDLSDSVALSDAVFDVLAAALGERFELTGDHHEDARRRALRLRIEAFMAEHLGDPDLTVAGVADAHHVSVRFLQKLFEERQDTVSAWIRRHRLEATRRELGNPALGDRQIGVIGARWGFADAAAFARAFRHEFGTTPSEYRAQSAGER